MVPAWYHVGLALCVFDSKIIVYFWFFLIFTRAGPEKARTGDTKNYLRDSQTTTVDLPCFLGSQGLSQVCCFVPHISARVYIGSELRMFRYTRRPAAGARAAGAGRSARLRGVRGDVCYCFP